MFCPKSLIYFNFVGTLYRKCIVFFVCTVYHTLEGCFEVRIKYGSFQSHLYVAFSWMLWLVGLFLLAVLVSEVDMGCGYKNGKLMLCRHLGVGVYFLVCVCVCAYVSVYVCAGAPAHTSCHPCIRQCPTGATPIKNVWTRPCLPGRRTCSLHSTYPFPPI